MAFPASPSLDQEYTDPDSSIVWKCTKIAPNPAWRVKSSPANGVGGVPVVIGITDVTGLQSALAAVTSAATAATNAANAGTTHAGRTDNPHGVTKAQVGLGNVDNTSDADKPISLATAQALENKASLSHDEIAIDITTTPLYTLPDPVGMTNGDSVLVRFNGTNSVNGVCEIKTTNNRNIVYKTTGAIFWTPGRGELVRFIAFNESYVAEIVQGGLPFAFILAGSGGWYQPPSSWARSALTVLTGDTLYRRSVGVEHATLPCHGRYAFRFKEHVVNYQASPSGLYIGGGSGSSPYSYSQRYIGKAPYVTCDLIDSVFGDYFRDDAVSQFVYGVGLSAHASSAALQIKFIGR